MSKEYKITTVKIEKDLKEKLKIRSIKTGLILQDLINDIIKKDQEQYEKQKSKKNG